ncbi:MAG: SDR family oxidoreductase [Proteobacteria bacterium]|nr:SDR family oxidoreductase [Pseudomonadota bacterium]
MGDRVQGKVVFITGGSDGIGKATAIRLAREGAHVVVCARRAEKLAETRSAIEAFGGAVETRVLDVGDTDAYAAAIADVAARHGRLDGLINNAMSVRYTSILDTTLEDWRQDFLVNADAVFVGTREALRVMYRQRSGSIVNISSLNGIRAMSGMSSYSASKAALIQLSAVAAIEAAPYGVRVNVVAPGQVATPAVEHFAQVEPARAAQSTAVIPMQRSGRPEELASTLLFLISDESTYITGACLPVDGGKAIQLYIPS